MKFAGATVLTFTTLDSTNDEARRQATAGAGHGTVIFAAEQTAGRGRRGRAWQSPRGNLHCSLLLDPGNDKALAPQLTFVGALGLWDALSVLVPQASFHLKWPNDVLCNGQKIAGMLLEWAEPLAILGVGVNVVEAPTIPLLYLATCLHRHGCDVEPWDLLAKFCAHLEPWYLRWREEGFAPLRQAWLDRATGVGAPITARLADESVLEGRFVGLDSDGALLLENEEGQRTRVVAGDVFF